MFTKWMCGNVAVSCTEIFKKSNHFLDFSFEMASGNEIQNMLDAVYGNNIAYVRLNMTKKLLSVDVAKCGTFLLIAAKFREWALVRFLLDCGADTSVQDNWGTTILMSVAKTAPFELFKFVLDITKDVNVRDDSGENALHIAAVSGNCDSAMALIQRGADVNAIGFLGQRTIHYAARGGCLELVKYLHAAGKGVNVIDDLGRTPVYFAISQGHSNVVRFLLNAGANVNAVSGNVTASHVAARCGIPGIVDLIEMGRPIEVVLGDETEIETLR
jgi:ankyrin repeat protein